MAKSVFYTSKHVFFLGFCHRAAVLQTQVPKLCTVLHLSLLYILILGTYSKFARENKFPIPRRLLSTALLERWPQVCRVKITCTKLPTNRFVFTTKNSMKYVVNWIPLRIHVHSRNTQPHINRKKKAKKTPPSGFYFEPRAGGETNILGFYNNKQTNKQNLPYNFFTAFVHPT